MFSRRESGARYNIAMGTVMTIKTALKPSSDHQYREMGNSGKEGPSHQLGASAVSICIDYSKNTPWNIQRPVPAILQGDARHARYHWRSWEPPFFSPQLRYCLCRLCGTKIAAIALRDEDVPLEGPERYSWRFRWAHWSSWDDLLSSRYKGLWYILQDILRFLLGGLRLQTFRLILWFDLIRILLLSLSMVKRILRLEYTKFWLLGFARKI